jgi:hypothetical protein
MKKTLFFATLALFLTNCGGGGGTKTNSNPPTIQTQLPNQPALSQRAQLNEDNQYPASFIPLKSLKLLTEFFEASYFEIQNNQVVCEEGSAKVIKKSKNSLDITMNNCYVGNFDTVINGKIKLNYKNDVTYSATFSNATLKSLNFSANIKHLKLNNQGDSNSVASQSLEEIYATFTTKENSYEFLNFNYKESGLFQENKEITFDGWIKSSCINGFIYTATTPKLLNDFSSFNSGEYFVASSPNAKKNLTLSIKKENEETIFTMKALDENIYKYLFSVIEKSNCKNASLYKNLTIEPLQSQLREISIENAKETLLEATAVVNGLNKFQEVLANLEKIECIEPNAKKENTQGLTKIIQFKNCETTNTKELFLINGTFRKDGFNTLEDFSIESEDAIKLEIYLSNYSNDSSVNNTSLRNSYGKISNFSNPEHKTSLFFLNSFYSIDTLRENPSSSFQGWLKSSCNDSYINANINLDYYLIDDVPLVGDIQISAKGESIHASEDFENGDENSFVVNLNDDSFYIPMEELLSSLDGFCN